MEIAERETVTKAGIDKLLDTNYSNDKYTVTEGNRLQQELRVNEQ
jgi:hypothetical protein